MIGDQIRIHEHGFIELVDVMGNDNSIVQAARVSFNKDDTIATYQADRGLIRYLMRNHHSTPFEMVEFKFHCKMPIHVARQWIRHRTANVNEISARYTQLPEEYYVPKDSRIQEQSTINKQGSGKGMAQAQDWADGFNDEAHAAFVAYKARVAAGMSNELARNNLPLSTYTRWYWKCDLHNIFNFLRLRMDSHAQEEIRMYANAMAELVKERCPLAWEAFEDYRLNAISLSAPEQKILRSLIVINDDTDPLIREALRSQREYDEFKSKLLKISDDR